MVGLNQSLRANASVESDAGHNGIRRRPDETGGQLGTTGLCRTGKSPLPKIRRLYIFRWHSPVAARI